jgi:hypothetical protein
VKLKVTTYLVGQNISGGNMKNKFTWEDYEQEKRKIQRKDLPPKEYEEEIRKLSKRMGL